MNETGVITVFAKFRVADYKKRADIPEFHMNALITANGTNAEHLRHPRLRLTQLCGRSSGTTEVPHRGLAIDVEDINHAASQITEIDRFLTARDFFTAVIDDSFVDVGFKNYELLIDTCCKLAQMESRRDIFQRAIKRS